MMFVCINNQVLVKAKKNKEQEELAGKLEFNVSFLPFL